MKWYWYCARSDELMMDLDSRTLLEIAVKRLERINGKDLKVWAVFVAESHSAEHYHMIVRLRMPLPAMHRMGWQLFLMDHVYRSFKNIFRVLENIPNPSLLISPGEWKWSLNSQSPSYFWRKHDATCTCESHKDSERILKCPAHKKLRG